jgi:hypothetical protein
MEKIYDILIQNWLSDRFPVTNFKGIHCVRNGNWGDSTKHIYIDSEEYQLNFLEVTFDLRLIEGTDPENILNYEDAKFIHKGYFPFHEKYDYPPSEPKRSTSVNLVLEMQPNKTYQLQGIGFNNHTIALFQDAIKKFDPEDIELIQTLWEISFDRIQEY